MPRVWYFPRWRELLMQAIMWLALGGAVALASLLDRHLRNAQILDLSPQIIDGPIHFRFPAGWKTWTRQPVGDATAHVASETTDGVTRSLIISRQLLPCPMAPVEYILRATALAGDINENQFRGVTIDGWPGQTITYAGRRISFGSGAELQFTICSAVMLPSRQAMMIRLDKNAAFDDADERLYRQVLGQVSISTAQPAQGGVIHPAEGISVDVPSELSVYSQPDPLLQAPMAVELTDAGGWISAQFVPVAVSGGSGMPGAALVTGLAARDQLDLRNPAIADRWLAASITAQGPNHWTIDPRDPPNDIVTGSRIAHLVTGNGQQALVVILTAYPPATAVDLDHLWDEMVAAVHIAKSPPLGQALQAGAALLRTKPLPTSDNFWWLWSRGSSPIGFTQQTVSHAPNSVLRYTACRNWNGTVTAITQQWGTSADSTPWTSMIRADAETNVDDPLVFFFGQTTTVSDWIITTVRDRGGGENPMRVTFSPAFVSSQYLPGLLPNITKTQTAFWTDRFVAVQGELIPSPLLLFVHRIDGPGNLSCIEAQVNGTGELSRWYFAPNGKFDHADFASELHLRPTTENEIQSTFAGDRRLTAQPH